MEIILNAYAVECLADGINPTRFCSSCGTSNPHVTCDSCIGKIADELNEMADAIADMEPEPEPVKPGVIHYICPVCDDQLKLNRSRGDCFCSDCQRFFLADDCAFMVEEPGISDAPIGWDHV